jgi:uncharacterized radical SAM protein YgiQ
MIFEKESNGAGTGRLIEPAGDMKVVVNPPYPPMTTEEFDRSFDLPYTYLPHPRYSKKGSIPAYEMIKFSVNIHRGCFGGCSFCAIAAHQGKQVVSRSERSVVSEIEKIRKLPGFRGNLSDLGGPSANMYGMKGRDMDMCLKCSRPSCIWPSICPNLDTDHTKLLALYRKVRSLPGIRKAFVGSGIRYDLFLSEWNRNAGKTEREYFRELVRHHVSGRLKVAPEHTDKEVLKLMRKVPFEVFRKLKERFDEIVRQDGLNFELVPYFISSHPGSDKDTMKRLSNEVRSLGIRPEQVQDFTPTPMTLSTLIYYTGFDPATGRKIFVERDPVSKKRQKDYFFWYKNFNTTHRKK